VTLIAIEEHWIMPDLTSALNALPVCDESLAFNEMGDHQQRLEDLGARGIFVRPRHLMRAASVPARSEDRVRPGRHELRYPSVAETPRRGAC
jgi:hypothetical protein